MSDKTYLAVNGTLMRGLELNPNMIAAGGVFVREDMTDAHYRLWSIGDRHPGMIRVATGGSAVALEIWELPLVSFASLLLSEPAGLAIGKVTLKGGSQVLGVLAEPWLVENQKEITQHGSWRVYTGHSHSA
ncbi:allophanate hydrolase-related protein [Caballeronia sp.]|uniref:allophanate hydrolase-related protein n=1 Tax=Caballeronia sp. TaxID=1931223 RepID=UPI003C464121